MQLRPCFLVIDAEHAGSISTRKLVLETAKYNVITAFSCLEAQAELERFPRVNGVVLNSATRDGDMPALLEQMRRLPEVKLIVVGQPSGALQAYPAAAVVDSFAPAQLLATMGKLFPRQATELQEHEEELSRADV